MPSGHYYRTRIEYEEGEEEEKEEGERRRRCGWPLP
jgi:hypothetical protein